MSHNAQGPSFAQCTIGDCSPSNRNLNINKFFQIKLLLQYVHFMLDLSWPTRTPLPNWSLKSLQDRSDKYVTCEHWTCHFITLPFEDCVFLMHENVALVVLAIICRLLDNLIALKAGTSPCKKAFFSLLLFCGVPNIWIFNVKALARCSSHI
jgi:hypothetical protein